MKPACNVATLIERFFTERLMRQQAVRARQANPLPAERPPARLSGGALNVRLCRMEWAAVHAIDACQRDNGAPYQTRSA